LMIYLIGILSFPLVNVKWLDFQAVTLINRLALGIDVNLRNNNPSGLLI